MKINDIIKVEACESLGTPACNASILEFDTLTVKGRTLNVLYVSCDDGGDGYVTAAAPHRVVDDMCFILQ